MKASFFEVLVGLAGITAAIAGVLQLLKREKKDESAAKIYEFLSENIPKQPPSKTRVPHGRSFSSKILQCPSLEELGVKPPFAYLPFIIPHVKSGDWVKKGDKLVTYSIVKYVKNEKPPLLWRLIFKDRTSVKNFTLNSPVSGLVINLRFAHSRVIPDNYIPGLFYGCITSELKLPNILIPKNEPKWDSYNLNNFLDEICNYISRNWRVSFHNTGSGDYKKIRLLDAINNYNSFKHNDYNKQQLDLSIKQAEEKFSDIDRNNISWPIFKYKELSKKDEWLDRYIDELRNEDDQLYNLLDHLVENPELSDD